MKYLSNFKKYKLVNESIEDLESIIEPPTNNIPSDEDLAELQEKSPSLQSIRQITGCQNDQIKILESEDSVKAIINLPTKNGNLIFVCYPSQIIKGGRDFELIDGKVEFIKTYNSIDLYNSDSKKLEDLKSNASQYGVTLQILGKQNRDYVTGWVGNVMRRFAGGDKEKNYTEMNQTELRKFIQYVFDNFG